MMGGEQGLIGARRLLTGHHPSPLSAFIDLPFSIKIVSDLL